MQQTTPTNASQTLFLQAFLPQFAKLLQKSIENYRKLLYNSLL
jgi:hypothetical protein